MSWVSWPFRKGIQQLPHHGATTGEADGKWYQVTDGNWIEVGARALGLAPFIKTCLLKQ